MSVVTATYNRSNILSLTIESLLRSSFDDWELIVVGDHCTDDTAAVVASFSDSRIRFVNLATHYGEQSGPNQEGILLARGRYIAFLNHDDLWVPEHLEVCLGEIERTRADIVHTVALTIDHQGVAHLAGVSRHGGYDGLTFTPASTWMLSRCAIEEIGPWLPARRLFLAPSQDWLFRAWKANKKIVAIPRVTVIAVLSGRRRNSYADRQSSENERIAALLRDDPGFVNGEISFLAQRLSVELGSGVLPLAFGAVKNGLKRGLLALRIHPTHVHFAARYRRRGGFVEELRRTRALPPLPEQEGP